MNTLFNYNEKIDPIIPSKVLQIMDGNCKLLFIEIMRLSYPFIIKNKADSEGFVEIPMKVLSENTDFSRKKLRGVLSTLNSNGIISVKCVGASKGINGKGTDINKFRINFDKINEYCASPFKKSIEIITENYNDKSFKVSYISNISTINEEKSCGGYNQNVKYIHHKDMVNINESDEYIHHKDMVNINESDEYIHHKDMVNINDNGGYNCGGYNQSPYSNIILEGNNSNNIIKKEKKIKKKLDKEKNKKEVEDLVQFRGNATIAKNTFGNDFSSSNNESKIEDNFIDGEDEDFKGVADHLPMDIDMRCFEDDGLPHNTGRGLTAIQALEKRINDDPNAPKLPLKYFNPMEIPDTITEDDEFTKWMTAIMFKMSRVNVWCDFVNIRNNYYSIRKAVDRGYEIGTTVKTWNEKKMTEKWQGVLTNKFRYFIKKYSNLPMQHGYEDMYSTLGIEPLSDEEYIKRQKEWLEKNNPKEFNEVKDNKDWQPWMMEGNGYVDEIEDDNEDYDFIREDIGKDIDPSVVNGMNDEEMSNFVCDAK